MLTYSPFDSNPPSSHSISQGDFEYFVNFCERVSDSIGNGNVTCNDNGNSGACQGFDSDAYWNIGSSANMHWVDYVSK